MPESVNNRWVLARRPAGAVTDENFRWIASHVPSPGEGQVLVKNLWLSLDPTQILFTYEGSGENTIPIGGVMKCIASGQIVESRLPGYAAGDFVQGWFGWENYTVVDDRPQLTPGLFPLMKIPPEITPDMAIGVLGLTGMAAYLGVMDVAKPRANETFVVSSAAGGVGSIAGQIAKLHGSRVIGIAGGKERCDRVVVDLGFDGAIDRRSEDIGSRLDQLCPDGVDMFFDNNALPAMMNVVLARMRSRGRVVLCGASQYYIGDQTTGELDYISLIMKRIRMEGVYANDSGDRLQEARKALSGWIREGKLKPVEDVMIGLENAPRALHRVFAGENFGKQLLKV
ncbi:MAG: NADP-dependent oxidoreductase [Nitrososphaerota archaeon]|nr:NADP-dependent oxidoreductase [Nitrososphaerota archaeon]MDG6943181.1 NADP-dependent oxidoreductase [Nitrososphaerota archaeon]MDG6950941.1 NADP-dependent oxidoreductase [Nitrososphaerota archaeon]